MYPPGFTPDKPEDKPDLSGFTPDPPDKQPLPPLGAASGDFIDSITNFVGKYPRLQELLTGSSPEFEERLKKSGINQTLGPGFMQIPAIQKIGDWIADRINPPSEEPGINPWIAGGIQGLAGLLSSGMDPRAVGIGHTTAAPKQLTAGKFIGGEAGMAEPRPYQFDLGPNKQYFDVPSGTVRAHEFGESSQVPPNIAATHGRGLGKPANVVKPPADYFSGTGGPPPELNVDESGQVTVSKPPPPADLPPVNPMRPELRPDFVPERKPGMTPQEVNSTMVEARQRADQIVHSGPEPLMSPDEIPLARMRYNDIMQKAQNGTITPEEIAEGMQLDARLRAVNFGETGTPNAPANKTPPPTPEPVQPPEPPPQQPFNPYASPEPTAQPIQQPVPAEGVKPPPPTLEPEAQALRDQTAQPQPQPGMQEAIRAQHYPSTGIPEGANIPGSPEIRGGIRQPAKEYPGYKGEISNEESVMSEATPEDIERAKNGPLKDFLYNDEGGFNFDPIHKWLFGNDAKPGKVGEEFTGEEAPKKKVGPITQTARIVRKTTRVTLGAHVPGTAISFHGFSEVARHALFGPTYNPIDMVGRGIEGLHMMVRPSVAEDWLAANPDYVLEARQAGVTNKTGDIGGPMFPLWGKPTVVSNILNKGFDIFSDPKYLFDQLIPTLKTKQFIGLVDQMQKQGMSYEQAAPKAAESVNNVFGGMNLKQLQRHPETQKMWRILALAPDWLESNLRLGGGIIKGLTDPNNPAYKIYRVGAANLATTVTTMNIINAINNNGKFMFQNDPGHEFDLAVGKDDKGRVRYYRWLGTGVDFVRIPLELAHVAVDQTMKGGIGRGLGETARAGTQMARSRASEPIQFLTDMLSNTDWKGNPIFGRNQYGQEMKPMHQLYNIGSDFVSHFAPPQVSAPIDYGLGKISGEEAIAKALGLPLDYKKPEKPPKRGTEKKWKY